MERVKPCPFCGGSNILFQAFSIGEEAYCQCNDCEVRLEIKVPWEDMTQDEHDELCAEKLIEKWNSRVS